MTNLDRVSLVLPCLNEEAAITTVIRKAQDVFRRNRIDGEILVVDNGSTDRSAELAMMAGVRVLSEPRRGYGHACLTGMAAATGDILVMGDADDTYDFETIPKFLAMLRSGQYDFVTGSRYLGGGNSRIPFLHRTIGNPALTRLLNLLFGTQYTDVYCGLRAFTREAYARIRPVTTGMEFNLELAINAKLARLRVAEVPIVLGSRKGTSKLKTFRDGWRSLRMMLLCSPNTVFLVPGVCLSVAGAFLQGVVFLRGLTYHDRSIGLVMGAFGALFAILGFKILSLWLHAKTYSWNRRYNAENRTLSRFYETFTFEKGVVLGLLALACGFLILGAEVWRWLMSGAMPAVGLEWIPIGITCVVIGTETVFTSLFISAMSLGKRYD